MSWWSRLANVLRSDRVHRDLDEELQFHIDERTRDLMAAGMTRESAAAEAARRLGSPLRLREESLDVKLLPWFDSLGRDVRLGVRMLRKNAGVTMAALVSLSLALGACVAAFALVDALILRRLPVREPDQLVYVAFSNDGGATEAETFNDPLFVHLREASRGRVDLFAMSTQVMRPVVFGGGGKEPVRTQFVSGDAFERLGIPASAGRMLAAADDRQPGAHPVAVISHAFWTRRFGGDPSVIGRWFALDERPFQIVGVAGRAFSGVEPGRPTDVWMPYAMYNPRAFGNAQFNWFRTFGRLQPAARRDEVQAVLQAAFTNFRRDHVESLGPGRSADEIARFVNAPVYVRSAANGPSPLRRQFERPLWILACSAALVLLIAGSNVANLFLARTAAREREMALRLSIGAGRARLIQQVLVESALVAGAACVLGLVVASIAAPTVISMLAPPADPVQLDLRADSRVMAVAGLLTLLITTIFGLAPAIRASGVAPIGALKPGGRSGTGVRVMRPFVAIQVAFGLIVLFVGNLLVLSFARVSSVDPGFATSDVLLISLEPVQRLDAPHQRAALIQTLDRLRGVPGVQAASSAEYSTLGRAWTHYVRPPGAQLQPAMEVTMAPVTDGFFETMRIPILAGRGFVPRDLRTASTAIVVNETFARRYFGSDPAVGRTLAARFADSGDSPTQEIVGVAADTRHDLRRPAAPTIYIPLRLRSTGVLHVRVAGDAAQAAARLREEIRTAAPALRVTSVTSQAAAVDQTLIRERLLALLSGFFAIVGVVLAAVGLYGVLSYSVLQRTREIGIRIALGARRERVVWTIAADVTTAVVAGTAVGLAGALYLSRFVASLLFEITPLSFWSVALPLAALLLAALLATAIPGLRAARLEPAAALRYE